MKDSKSKDSKKAELTDGGKMRAMISDDRVTAIEHLNACIEILDKWEGLLVLETVVGTTWQIQCRSANHQRGGGGKRTAFEHEGIHYESGQALCNKLMLPVDGDSAVRVINRYIANNPTVDIKIVK